MERITFKNETGLTLVGHFYAAPSKAIIIMTHGFLSNKSSSGRFDRFALKLQQNGYNVLTYDCGGYGESDDTAIHFEKQVTDLRAAKQYSQQLGMEKFAFWGHSLGGRLSLTCYDTDIETMILTGPVTGAIAYQHVDNFSKEQVAQCESSGSMIFYVDDPWRTEIVLDKQMLLDFDQMDQAATLQKVNCPILIIHGTEGDLERELTQITKQGLDLFPKSTKLIELDGADHGFMEQLNEIETLGLHWLHEHFQLS
ncbi:nitrilotriacetate monooxygenase FMN-dependent oxidoreductase [Listeria grandensis FSL F6-0971]|uniref:Nitrilotriacetate monooxygenase FMN-dependent oxidoreductase n=1 Tax=Listeria grandensis FSL F6-0971 TaxID=1265819 RepID=W7BU04_9LIST|nr:alpha/beta hydrolase [Listeria grandensis]EUJ23773.1 nitrilotriacetate monooxygenase FMN-dependent oxidoreductase [Listeria grandensis FSL F6-0971]